MITLVSALGVNAYIRGSCSLLIRIIYMSNEKNTLLAGAFECVSEGGIICM